MMAYLNKSRFFFRNFSTFKIEKDLVAKFMDIYSVETEMREAFVLIAMMRENTIGNEFLGLAVEAWQVDVGRAGELSMFLNTTGIEYLEDEAGITVWGAEFNASYLDLVEGIFCQDDSKISTILRIYFKK